MIKNSFKTKFLNSHIIKSIYLNNNTTYSIKHISTINNTISISKTLLDQKNIILNKPANLCFKRFCNMPKELKHSSKSPLENTKKDILKKQINRRMEFLKDKYEYSDYFIKLGQEHFAFKHFYNFDGEVNYEKIKDEKTHLLSVITGYDDRHKNVSNDTRKTTIKEFEEIKDVLIKHKPHLEKYDLEKRLLTENEEERIELIKEKIYSKGFNYDEYNMYKLKYPIDGKDEYVMLYTEERDYINKVLKIQQDLEDEDEIIDEEGDTYYDKLSDDYSKYKKKCINRVLVSINEHYFRKNNRPILTTEALDEEYINDQYNKNLKKEGLEINNTKSNKKINNNELIQKQKKLKKRIPLIEELNDNDCILLLELLNEDVNYLESYYSKKIHEFEHKVAFVRAFMENDYVTRYNGNIEYDTEQFFKENDEVSKEMVRVTYKQIFKESLKSHLKSLDNKRIDIGLIITRPPIFLYMPKEEIDYLKYKVNFDKKYGTNVSSQTEDLDILNSDLHDLFKSSEGHFKNESPNIRKKRSVTLDHENNTENNSQESKSLFLKLKENAPYNYNYRNSYLIKDNSEEDPYDMYCLNSKYYLRVDPTIKDPKNIQTDSCYSIYFICKNKFTQKWVFPTMPVYNSLPLKDNCLWLYRDLTKNKFEIYYPREYKPIFLNERNFFEYEYEDKRNHNLFGVRTYYYVAYHDKGAPSIDVNDLHPYDDFLMITKDNLRNYFDEDYYKSVVKYLVD